MALKAVGIILIDGPEANRDPSIPLLGKPAAAIFSQCKNSVVLHGGGRLHRGRANITQKENELLISGQGHPSAQDKEYLYRGIAGRDFERRFQLADYVKVMGARLAEGMLSIDLKRELPEEKKARAIRIEGADGQRAITQQ